MSELKAFRASPETAAAIAAAAEREGVSQSEIIRSAVEARLGVAEPDAEPDVYALIVHAAKGELQAQRQLCQIAIANTMAGAQAGEAQPDLYRGFSEALLLARMAAAHGTAQDQVTVLHVLGLMNTLCPDHYHDSDALDVVGRLDMMADAGIDGAADCLEAMMGNVPAEHVASLRDGAKDVRARLRDEMEASR